MKNNETSNRLLPESFRQSVWLLWLWILPQALLLFLNGRATWLAIGEMTAPQKVQGGWIAGYELGLLLLGVISALVLWLRKRPVGYGLCTVGLALHIGYLWMFILRFMEAWPAAVAPWMLPESELVYYQFACVMPVLFYFGVRLACFEMPVRRSIDTVFSLVAFVLIPAAWYLLFQLSRLLFTRWMPHRFPETLAMVFFAVSTVLVLMAFMRLMLLLYGWLQERSWSRWMLPLAAGLLAPIGGLLLNRKIPFPCDFQSPGIYVLTVINGLVVLLPSSRSANRAALLWLVRSALYAFSFYFFVVFLPFLPLSLLAMLACGAGFLILAPTLLFVIHTRQLLSEGTALVVRWGRTLTVMAFVLCVVLIPVGFTLRALADKSALQQAVTVGFSPDLQTGQTGLNRTATKRALAHLRDMKDGLYLPFLSDYYNQLVFNGMVLPDDKMQLLHRMFFGEAAAKPETQQQWSLFLAPNARTRGRGNLPRVELPHQIQLEDLAVKETQTNDLIRVSLTLTLKNKGSANAEFVTDIVLPDVVLVSGFWLDVAGQRKPGHIVEKKTAQWVYHMIRDFTRRDPGLLAFKDEDRLTLNVYPFATNETRTTGLELLFPRGLHPRVRVGERELTLGLAGNEETAQPLVANQPDGRVEVILSSAAVRGLPSVTRQPYLHFIVDRSSGATNALPDLATQLTSLAKQLGGTSCLCRVTFANYEWADLTPDPISLNALRDTVIQAGSVLPCRGGFCYDRAIAHALLQAQEQGGGSAPDGTLRVPLCVVVLAKGTVPVSTINLATFRRFVPDLPFYYLQAEDAPRRIAFAGDRGEPAVTSDVQRPVVLFQSERHIAACLPESGGSVVSLPGTADSLQCFDPATKGFRPLPAVRAVEDPVYKQGLALWDAYRATVWAPDTLDNCLKALVDGSRATGIMMPLTSYMVVENSAQEKTLAQKEKQALGAQHALEFEETQPTQNVPETGTFWLLPVTLLLLFWRSHALRHAGTRPCSKRAAAMQSQVTQAFPWPP